jgi:4'-phosphopantetheinyl transferase
MIDGVHIWRADLDDPDWPQAEELPAAERKRAAGFLHEPVARRWVASRWALRCVLAHYLERAPGEIHLELSEQGKPRVADNSSLEFNLSHSGGLALVAVASRPVGVDIEAMRPDRNLLGLAQRALPADDADAVRAADSDERMHVFYRAWTRHEARLKCLGTGLGSPLSDGPVTVVQLDLAPGYAAAVAAAGQEPFSPDCRSLGPTH